MILGGDGAESVGGRALHGQGGHRVLLTGDVPEVMDDIVQQVLAETRDGELGSVRAPSRPSVLSRRNGSEPSDKRLYSCLEFVRHHFRILLSIAFPNRRLVLVPVLENRVVLGEHLPQAAAEDPEAVSDMGAVLQR